MDGVINLNSQLQENNSDQAHLFFLESLDRINRAIQQASTVDEMLQGVLQGTLEIFEVDRAWLLYPCDPDAAKFHAPMNAFRPQYSLDRAVDLTLETTPKRKEYCQQALAVDKPVTYGPEGQYAMGQETEAPYNVQAQIFMAVYPRQGKPWLFGLHQCSYARTWSEDHQQLFKEIGRRIADGLSNMLLLLDLRSNEEKLRTTLNSIGDAVIATDIDGRITRMNPVAEALTGYTFAEADNKSLSDFFHIVNAHTGEKVENPVDKVLATGSVVGMANHTVLISKDGKRFQIADSGAPILSDEGEIVGVVLVFRDVTDEYALQEQLQQSQKMEAIGQLAGGIAHDFNNILGGIMGATELLKKHLADTPQAEKYHGMILNSVERAAGLTEKLLAFSRKQPLAFALIDVHRTLADTIEILKSTVDRRIDFSVNLKAGQSVVMGDVSQLQNAFLNLGLNAVQSMPHGGVVSIASSVVSLNEGECNDSLFDIKPGRFLKIVIKDNGCGIAEDLLSRIFEPFFTTKKQGEGTGLGLAAVLGTIQQHEGGIYVDSELDRGTCFSILLPLVDDQKTENMTSSPLPIHGTGRILIVDDEEIMRDTAKAILEDLGYDVLVADDGSQGVALLKENPDAVDLVVLDMIMPTMNGLDCFKHMKQIKPDVRVILASGFINEEDLESMKKDGLSGFIRKPFYTLDLSQVVHDALVP